MEHPQNPDDQTPMTRHVTPPSGEPEGASTEGAAQNAAKPEVLRAYFTRLLQQNNTDITPGRKALFEAFATAPGRASAYQTILQLQQQVMNDWKEIVAIQDIRQATVQIPNARVGKAYAFRFEPEALGLKGLQDFLLEGFGETGLAFDKEWGTIGGTPLQSGEFRLTFRFRLAISNPEAPMEERPISLIINADPKSLWKELASDEDDPYWKSDTDTGSMDAGTRKVIAASKRGRSHAHEAKFRDDDFMLANLTGEWSLLVVADGAGSAKYSRRGSQLACAFLKEYFGEKTTAEVWAAFDATITTNAEAGSADTQKALSQQTISLLQGAAKGAHDAIAAEAKMKEATLRDFGTTLLFALVKQFPFGWFIASFGVGDGGIGLYTKESQAVQLLTRPDGGEFAGQTRFLTMPDIFSNPDFYQRFAISLVPDFTALILMTDGISDPKFSTDAALAKAEKWSELWEDIHGKNDDGAAVSFGSEKETAAVELLSWLDFWSPGNHDDRTIAILY